MVAAAVRYRDDVVAHGRVTRVGEGAVAQPAQVGVCEHERAFGPVAASGSVTPPHAADRGVLFERGRDRRLRRGDAPRRR